MPDQPADNLPDLQKKVSPSPLSSERPTEAPVKEPVSDPQEETIPAYAVSETPKRKISSSVTIAGSLVLLLMAATLPAAIILVQNKTYITPRAQEEVSTTAHPPQTDRKTYFTPSEGEQVLDRIQEIKPQDLKIEPVSLGVEKITFITRIAVIASIAYSPDENWNYLPLMLDYDRWKDNHNFENLKTISPVGGRNARTEHEFEIEGLASGQKYYFAIEIEKPGENAVYLFDIAQPGSHYTFTAE